MITNKGRSPFPSTVWSDIMALRDRSTSRAALDRLMRAYWQPVFAYVRAAWKCPVEDAMDFTQAFFAHLLEKQRLQRLRPGIGTFRGYLKIAVKHFLLNGRRASEVRDRAGLRNVAGDALPDAPSPAETPEEAYDREWSRQVLNGAVAELRDSLYRAGRGPVYDAFHAYCLDRHVDESDATYDDIARRLGLTSSEVRHGLSYCRSILRDILRRRVAEYSADDEIESELARLVGGR